MNDKAKKAKATFNKGFNCAQSVLTGYSKEELNDEKQLFRIAAAFGGGINGMGKTCGVVTGALMALGLRYGHDRFDDYEKKEVLKRKTEAFIDAFTKEHGSLECKTLLEPYANSLNPYKKCPDYVESAVRILENLD
jgi:C_GCAxxG_C_C family probable redox protein